MTRRPCMIKRPADDTVWSLVEGRKEKRERRLSDERKKNDYKDKEGNVLFNDAINTFYLRLYGVRHMVKDHSDSEKGNPLPPHRLLFTISSKGSFICTIPQTGYHIPRPLLHQSWSTGFIKTMRENRMVKTKDKTKKKKKEKKDGYEQL